MESTVGHSFFVFIKKIAGIANKKQYDKVGFNQKQFDCYKKLIALRKNNPVLSTGDMAFLETTGNRLVYKRFDNQNEIIVLFNLEKTQQMFNLPNVGRYVDILTGKTFNGNSVKLKPLTALVLKKTLFDSFETQFLSRGMIVT